MSSIARPHGFDPVQRRDGLPYAGFFRQYEIASGYATAIGYGDLVSLDANGQLVKATPGTGGTVSTLTAAVGVFVGCQYTDPNLKYLLNANGYVGGVVASDIVGYVVDDPTMVFEVQADGPLALSTRGNNIGLIDTAPSGSGSNLKSRIAVASATAAAGAPAAALPFRIVDFKRAADSRPGDLFTDVLVSFNFGQHIFDQANGI